MASPQLKALRSAPPPWHSLALVGAMIAVFVSQLPSLQALDEVATQSVFTHILFPDYLTVQELAYFRFVVATIIFGTSFQTIFLYDGWEQTTTYMKGSKLIATPNKLKGFKTMFPFTSWSWNLLGASFLANAVIAQQAAAGTASPPWLLRSALVLWQIAAPFTLLVAAVIRYAIWPAVLKAGNDTKNLKSMRNKLMHNMNVAFCWVEAALWSGLPVHGRHWSLAPLVGCIYVIFSWLMSTSWNKPEHGPQFIYFFFDTTLGSTTSKALLVLLTVLLLFYGIFVGALAFLEYTGSGLWGHVAFVVAVCASVMRFRD